MTIRLRNLSALKRRECHFSRTAKVRLVLPKDPDKVIPGLQMSFHRSPPDSLRPTMLGLMSFVKLQNDITYKNDIFDF